MKSVKFDTIIAMNLLGLGVLSSGFAANLMANDIPAMTQSLDRLPEPRFVDYTEEDALEACNGDDSLADLDLRDCMLALNSRK